MNFQLENSKDIKEKIDQKKVALLPIGATEAHGPHLPLATDTILAERLSYQLAEEINAFVLPSLPYGQVWSLKNFPGSINVSNESLISLIFDIGKSLYEQGFTVLAIINAHLGNQVAMKEAARKLYSEISDFKVFYFFYPGMDSVVRQVSESNRAHSTYFHACEIETSIMLYLAEEYVRMDRAINELPTLPPDADFTPTPWEEFTNSGVLGEAKLATKEKGEKIVQRALQEMAKIINDAKK